MGFLFSSDPPIAKKVPPLPKGYRWGFTVHYSVDNRVSVEVKLQKRWLIFWRTIHRRYTSPHLDQIEAVMRLMRKDI